MCHLILEIARIETLVYIVTSSSGANCCGGREAADAEVGDDDAGGDDHTSHGTRHTSHFTRHTSHVTLCTSHMRQEKKMAVAQQDVIALQQQEEQHR